MNQAMKAESTDEAREREDLKRRIAAQHAEDNFRTRDPSIWQWAKAYDYVEAAFGREPVATLRSLVRPEPRTKKRKPLAVSPLLASMSNENGHTAKPRLHVRGDLGLLCDRYDVPTADAAYPRFPAFDTRSATRFVARLLRPYDGAANDDSEEESR